jgi:hypothetical protein
MKVNTDTKATAIFKIFHFLILILYNWELMNQVPPILPVAYEVVSVISISVLHRECVCCI